MARTLTTTALFVLTAGCLPVDNGPHQPTLDEVSADADAAVDLVDRSAVLTNAVEDEAGEAIDLSSPSDGFMMRIDSDDLQAVGDETGGDGGPGGPPTFQNVWHAVAALAVADLATAAVVGPPAAAIAVAVDGEVTEIEPWLWNATNTVTGPNGKSATFDFNVAWVGVGWLAEMRLSTDDGAYDDTLWFNGFIAYGGGLGWWDIYSGGSVVGVVEWIADGRGNAEFGIGALAGEASGDVLMYVRNEDGEGLVSYYDASIDFNAHVFVAADHSGEVLLPDYNGAEVACWASDLSDSACE